MPLVTLSAIRDAAKRIQSIARRTPVLDVSAQAGRPLWLKCEPQQPGGAFKIRGATNMLKRLPPDEVARGVITYSSGNHGQAVAYAARTVGATAVVVVPDHAPEVKVAAIEGYGATIVRCPQADRERVLAALVDENQQANLSFDTHAHGVGGIELVWRGLGQAARPLRDVHGRHGHDGLGALGGVRSRDLPRLPLEELSMGMSGDFETAVEEGATLVRVGSALFPPDDA